MGELVNTFLFLIERILLPSLQGGVGGRLFINVAIALIERGITPFAIHHQRVVAVRATGVVIAHGARMMETNTIYAKVTQIEEMMASRHQRSLGFCNRFIVVVCFKR